MIIDQQKLDKNNYDLLCLPDFINVEFINRKEMLNKFNAFPGRFKHKFMVVTSTYGNFNTIKSARDALSICFPDITFENSELFLFNDRNRLARIFRLAFYQYSMIEDGLANYIKKNISIYEVFRRLLCEKRYSSYKISGDEIQCKKIILLSPSRADISILGKTENADFLSIIKSKETIMAFFKCMGLCLNGAEIIIATQPIAIDNYSESGRDKKVYKALVKYLTEANIKYLVKVHPRENIDRYNDIFPKDTFITPKLPLEVCLLLNENKPKIVSIYSTAGSGFENYCNRFTLVLDKEASEQSNVFLSWDKDDTNLFDRFKEL